MQTDDQLEKARIMRLKCFAANKFGEKRATQLLNQPYDNFDGDTPIAAASESEEDLNFVVQQISQPKKLRPSEMSACRFG
ncbi:MAG: hypothetical protein CMH30_07100 [Micavibrio sp.]|nr:hypothetical protein [Micavibrio sp.]|tara:strand:+ start:1977 stop:2216 length:240 start_codon:yes stop_codon:yes gene_type:complete